MSNVGCGLAAAEDEDGLVRAKLRPRLEAGRVDDVGHVLDALQRNDVWVDVQSRTDRNSVTLPLSLLAVGRVGQETAAVDLAPDPRDSTGEVDVGS